MNYLGLDIGTTTICAAVTSDTGELIRSVTLKNDAAIVSDKKFEKIQSVDIIMIRCEEAIKKAVDGIDDIAAVGVTGQMHGIVYCDKNATRASSLFTWQDARGNEKYDATRTYCEYITEMTGYRVSPGFGLVTHFYNSYNGIVPVNAVTMCTIHDYAVMYLTDRPAPLLHVSDAASFGLFDLEKSAFDDEALLALGINSSILPEITADTVAAGTANVDFLPAGIPVSVAIGDNQASFLGSVESPEDSILVNMGTGSQVSVLTDTVFDPPVGEIRPYLDGKYLYVGSSLCGGRSYQLLEAFFKNCVSLFGVLTVDSTGEPLSLMPIMDRLSELSFVTEDPLIVNCEFCGTRNDPGSRGSITNIGVDNFTPIHLIGGLLRGTVAELYDSYTACKHLISTAPTHLVGSGNGIRKSTVWRDMFSEKFGMELSVPAYKEEAAFGASKLASLIK